MGGANPSGGVPYCTFLLSKRVHLPRNFIIASTSALTFDQYCIGMKIDIETPYDRDTHIAARLPDAKRIASIVKLDGSSVSDLAEFISECELEFLIDGVSDNHHTQHAAVNQRKLISDLLADLNAVQKRLTKLDQPKLHKRWRATTYAINQSPGRSVEDPDEIRASLKKLGQEVEDAIWYLTEAKKVDGHKISTRPNDKTRERQIIRDCVSFWQAKTGQRIKTSDADFDLIRGSGADFKDALKRGPRFVYEVIHCVGGSVKAQSLTKMIQAANKV
ncbi:MAG: hypothetical protein AAFP81_02300 [Pseudomonadota bacterium]